MICHYRGLNAIFFCRILGPGARQKPTGLPCGTRPPSKRRQTRQQLRLRMSIDIMKTPQTSSTRRQFLRATGTVAAGFMIVPRHVIAGSGQTPPSDRVNVAGIGVGGQGESDINEISKGSNIVALCDVDSNRAGNSFKKFPDAKQYRDFRKMLDDQHKNIDAVLVATPDHFHAVAAMAAIKHGKHVYCEKPLAHSIFEVRQLMKAARDHKVVTQLGNQGHSFDSIRNFCEWIWDGAIGNVHTINAGCEAVNSGIDQLPHLSEHHDVPQSLDWEQWLGPAQERPYNPAFAPASWRGWVPFGNGTIGDWTCHVVDPVFWALDLGVSVHHPGQRKGLRFQNPRPGLPKR